MKFLLGIPSVYRLFGQAIGGNRGRGIFVSEYLRPQRGNRILDIGCGEASILDHLSDVDYVGFDLSPSYISAAKRRYGKRGRFHCGSVTQNIIDEIGTFDIAVANGVLHHLTDAECDQLFRLARRALKVDGRLVTFDGCYLPAQSLLARYLLRADRGAFVRTPERYLALATQAFPNVSCAIREDLLPIPYSHFIMECVNT